MRGRTEWRTRKMLAWPDALMAWQPRPQSGEAAARVVCVRDTRIMEDAERARARRRSMRAWFKGTIYILCT